MNIIGFVIPLISKAAANDWELSSRLLRRTLEALIRQTNPNWCAVVVGNDCPLFWPEDPRIRFVCCDFPVPKTKEGRYADQKSKVKLGLIEIRKDSPVFGMRLDADDLVSKKLVYYAEINSAENGWILSKGFVYSEASTRLIYRWNLHMRSASTHVVKFIESDFPKSMESPDYAYLSDFWQHQRLAETLGKVGRSLKFFPWPAVIYVVGHASSNYVVGHASSNMGQEQFIGATIKEQIWRRLFSRQLTKKIRDEFTLEPLASIV
jgi:hypothetical protein